VDVEGGGVGAELVAQPQGVGAAVGLLHRGDHQGGEGVGGLHAAPLVPAGEGPTGAEPLGAGGGLSGEHARHGEGLPGLGAHGLRESFDLRGGAW